MLFLSMRHLLGRRKVTFMTFLGIFIGTAAFIVISGFFVGFQSFMTNSLVSSDAQVKITSREERLDQAFFRKEFFPDENFVLWTRRPFGDKSSDHIQNPEGWFERLENDKRVVAYSPIMTSSVLITQAGKSYNVNLTGVRPESYTRVTNILEKMIEGDFQSLDRGVGRIVITSEFATRIGLGYLDTLQVTSQLGKTVPLQIVGIYSSGNKMIDRGAAFVNIKDAQLLSGQSGQINQISVRVNDFMRAAEMANQWSLLTRDKIQSWDQINESVLGIFQTQNLMRYSVTIVILMIAAFSIFIILNMTVQQKRRDIAILGSMGFSTGQVAAVFLYQGVILGIAGSVFGCIVGYGICEYLSTLTMVQPGGGVTPINIAFETGIYVQGLVLGNLAAIIASYLPARMAASMQPIEIIRQGAE